MARKEENTNLTTEIVGITGGISIGTVAVIGLFAREYLWTAAPIVGFLVLLGVIALFFNYKINSKS